MHLHPRREVTTRFGFRMNCDVRDPIQATIAMFAVWEPNLSHALQKVIRSGDTVIDIGANVGYYSLLFADFVGPNGSVIAVEPMPGLAKAIADNAELNSYTNIRIANAAIATEPGEVTLYAPESNFGLATIRSDRGFPATMKVEALPLDRVLSAREASEATLIKIDVEGAEASVIEQILKSLDSYSPKLSVIVEACPADNPVWTDFFEQFRRAGFKAYEIPNYYDWMRLLEGEIELPNPVNEMPSQQTDLLFTRMDLSRL